MYISIHQYVLYVLVCRHIYSFFNPRAEVWDPHVYVASSAAQYWALGAALDSVRRLLRDARRPIFASELLNLTGALPSPCEASIHIHMRIGIHIHTYTYIHIFIYMYVYTQINVYRHGERGRKTDSPYAYIHIERQRDIKKERVDTYMHL